jgi:branched-chain amino acid transport system substrate-binding protein
MTSIVRLQLGLLICGLGVVVNLQASAAQSVKIGLINSYSGFLAQSGDEMQKGIDLYLKEHEQELPAGVKVELVRRDDGAVPDTGKRVAQELIAREQVQLLLGAWARQLRLPLRHWPSRPKFR